MSSAPLYTPSEGVGTDTPPQTPPNAKGSNGQGVSGQVGLLGNNSGAYMGGNTGPSSVYGLGGPLSSCSRNPAGVPMGSQSSDVPMNPASQRYPGSSGLPVVQPSHNNSNASSMGSTAFTPAYKT